MFAAHNTLLTRPTAAAAGPSAITIVSSAYAIVNNSRSPSLTFTGYTPALDDLIVMFPRDASPDATLTIPSGWVNALGGTTKVASDNNQTAVLYHFVTSGEVSAVTTTYPLTNLWSFAIFGSVEGSVLRGVSTSTPVDSVATGFSSTDTTTPHVLPALTGANLSTGSLVLGSVSRDQDGAYGSGPAGWTQINSTSSWSAAWYGYLTAATVAGVDVSSATVTPSAGDEYTAITIAFTPPSNVIVNGAFATSANWSGAGSNGRTISGGTANFTNSTNASDGGFNQNVTGLMTASKYYELTWTILNRTAGDVTPFIYNGSGEVRGAFRAANGTYQERLLSPAGAAPIQFGFLATAGSPTTLSVDNVSLVGPYNTATVGGA